MISSAQIRQGFLDFFRVRDHNVVSSSSLIPGNDPTLLFTNAGMVQFKDVFIGAEERSYTRATSAQKCMRVSGKHNDLENVGPSPRHHTFFEMLGNFSFGDYFKEEAIAYAWEFLTQVVGLDSQRLYPTIYLEDDDAFMLWQKIAGVPGSRITRLGKKDNFWAMGDTGPNGPCSEIIYDRGQEHCTCGRSDCSPAVECERWWELWNLVFMQFETTSDGATRPLPKPSIDTGMGMERLTAILQGKSDNYETDLFWPIILRTQQMLGHSDQQRTENIVSYRVIADHARAVAFLIADGVLPGNEGRNYVLRLILRRAARHGKMLGFEQPFMAEVLRVVMDIMGAHYHELAERRDFVLEAAHQEEERFLQTLDTGLNLLDQVVADVKRAGKTVIPGNEAFRLYDTYGFPLDLTRDVAKEHGLSIDEAAFHEAMEAQRARARAAQQFEVEQEEELYRALDLPATLFVGYDQATSRSQVLALVRDGQVHERVDAGQKIRVVLDRTPFYAESGGQIADTGVIEGPRGRIEVLDAYHPLPGLTVHVGRVVEGAVARGEQVEARIDVERHLDVARNHTATHLLHRALQKVLGGHARQAGSLVAPDRLRFDFTHLKPVSKEELRQIEREVNAAVRADFQVEAQVTSFDEARASGAMALFGEKYGDRVRMISVGDEYSRELCGGTHLHRTGQIGFFKILSESSIGSGLRRIEALTGRGAEAYVEQQLDQLVEAAAAAQAQPDNLAEKVGELAQQLHEKQREIDRLQSRELAKEAKTWADQAQEVTPGVRVLAKYVAGVQDVESLREMTDRLHEQPTLSSGAAIVLGAMIGGKPTLVYRLTPDLAERGLHAGRLVKSLAEIIGGGGGGTATMGQAGGRNADKLSDALDSAHRYLKTKIEAKAQDSLAS
jgi:alanyl-tRNA synthetase